MNKKSEKGITLIALIITIIVLLILAGVSIATLTGENGLLNKAETAKEITAQKAAEEQVQLAIMASYDANGEIDLGELKENLNDIEGATDITEDITDSSFPLSVTVNGQEVKLTKAGDTITAAAKEETTTPSDPEETPTTPEETAPYTAYSVGDEVTVGGESFYVLEASDGNTEIVTLLSKYNLNKEGTEQSDVGYTDTACVFSSTNYWSDDFTSSPFDLNDLGEESTGDAIAKAKSYATNKGATSGRLLTYNEANTLKTSISSDTTGKIAKMLWGTEATDGYLNFWLGSASYPGGVWSVFGEDSRLFDFNYDDNGLFGVRPVIEISKSLIS